VLFAMMIVCVTSNDAKTLTYEPMIKSRERKRNREKTQLSTHAYAYGHFAKL
jgi:hypothetical protein